MNCKSLTSLEKVKPEKKQEWDSTPDTEECRKHPMGGRGEERSRSRGGFDGGRRETGYILALRGVLEEKKVSLGLMRGKRALFFRGGKEKTDWSSSTRSKRGRGAG